MKPLPFAEVSCSMTCLPVDDPFDPHTVEDLGPEQVGQEPGFKLQSLILEIET